MTGTATEAPDVLECWATQLFDYLTEELEDCGPGIPQPCADDKGAWGLRLVPELEPYGDGSCTGAYAVLGDSIAHSGNLTDYLIPEGYFEACNLRVAFELRFGLKRCIAVLDEQGRIPTDSEAAYDALALQGDHIALWKAAARFVRRTDVFANIVGIERFGDGGCYGHEITLIVDAGEL